MEINIHADAGLSIAAMPSVRCPGPWQNRRIALLAREAGGIV
jgi:hypothetical protein